MPTHNTHDLLAPLFHQWTQMQLEISKQGGALSGRFHNAAPLFTPLNTPLQQLERHMDQQNNGGSIRHRWRPSRRARYTAAGQGSGSIDVAHQANEWISRAELSITALFQRLIMIGPNAEHRTIHLIPRLHRLRSRTGPCGSDFHFFLDQGETMRILLCGGFSTLTW